MPPGPAYQSISIRAANDPLVFTITEKAPTRALRPGEGPSSSLLSDCKNRWIVCSSSLEVGWDILNDVLQPASEARLEVTWDGGPVEFGDTVAYVCQQGLFLEAGRHIAEVRVTRDMLHVTIHDT